MIFITDIGIHDAVSDSSEELPLEVRKFEHATFYIKTSAPATLMMVAPDVDIAKGLF